MAKKMFYPEILKTRYSQATALFIRTLAHRVYRHNKNALIITCGASGSGKSYVDLELLRGIYAYKHGEFPTDEYVVDRAFFKLKDFLAILNSPEIQDSKKSRGQMFISEEIGTQAGNRTHQNIANRTYSYIVQTFRAKGMILFFNVPSFNFVDSQVRKQLHYLLETKMINKNKKVCLCKPLELQYNSRIDKLYFHNLKAQMPNNARLTIPMLDIPKIPSTLAKLYEEKKTEFINQLNQGLQNALDKQEQKENPPVEVKVTADPDDLAIRFGEMGAKIYYLKQEGKTYDQIKEETGVPRATAQNKVKTIELELFKQQVRNMAKMPMKMA